MGATQSSLELPVIYTVLFQTLTQYPQEKYFKNIHEGKLSSFNANIALLNQFVRSVRFQNK